MNFSFTIPGRPQGKARPRLGRGHFYTPEKTRNYEIEVGWIAKRSGVTVQDGPVRIDIVAQFRGKGGAEQKKPDCDNIGKIILDSLNGVAYFDDMQVTNLNVWKQMGPDDLVQVELTYL